MAKNQEELEHREERFERLLDGVLSGEDAAAATREAEDEPSLREEAALQARVDDALRRIYRPPEFELTVEAVEEPHEKPAVAGRAETPPRTAHQYWLVAALLLVCLGLWGRQGLVLWRDHKASQYETLTVAQVYRNCVESGFKPDWRCEDDREFAKTFYERQGQAVRLGPLPIGMSMTGLAYVRGLTKDATTMLARVDGEPVMIFVEKTDRTPTEGLDGDGSVCVHSTTLGPLTLVEVSPFETLKVAPHLQLLGEVPEQDTGRVPGEPE